MTDTENLSDRKYQDLYEEYQVLSDDYQNLYDEYQELYEKEPNSTTKKN